MVLKTHHQWYFEVRELIYVMLKGDDGVFLRQLTNLVFAQLLANALPFFDVNDSKELRLYYDFLSASMAAFIIKWVLSEEKAVALLAEILLQISVKLPKQLSQSFEPAK